MANERSAMASIFRAASPQLFNLHRNPNSLHSSFTFLHFPFHRISRNSTPKTASGEGRVGIHEANGPDLLKRPVLSPPNDEDDDDDDEEGSNGEVERDYEKKEGGESQWMEWEEQILKDIVPLIVVVKMVLHSKEYRTGERLSPEHERMILERLLPHHPAYEKKLGCGIDYITVGYHPDYENSRCLFIVRKDGGLVDFSYRKCIKGMVRTNYPVFAHSFIFRHIQRHSRSSE